MFKEVISMVADCKPKKEADKKCGSKAPTTKKK
jgi:hypothetical protein